MSEKNQQGEATTILGTHQIESVSIDPPDGAPAFVRIVILCAISNAAGVVASHTTVKGGNKNQDKTSTSFLPSAPVRLPLYSIQRERDTKEIPSQSHWVNTLVSEYKITGSYAKKLRFLGSLHQHVYMIGVDGLRD